MLSVRKISREYLNVGEGVPIFFRADIVRSLDKPSESVRATLKFIMENQSSAVSRPRCQHLFAKWEQLKEEKKDWQDQLKSAAPSSKPQLARIINNINLQITKTLRELDRCLGYPEPIISHLSGNATLTIDKKYVEGPHSAPIRAKAETNKYRTNFRITDFEDLNFQNQTPLGANTTTVSLVGPITTGYLSNDGHFSIKMELKFSHSLNIRDSHFSLTLSTRTLGKSLDQNGAFRASGNGNFEGGYLDKATGTMIVDGRFFPKPS